MNGEMPWDQIGGICAIIGVIAIAYQFYFLPKKKRAKEIEDQAKSLDHIRILWKSSEVKLDKLISDLSDYLNHNNYGENFFQMAITFNVQLRQLQYLKESDFNIQYYNSISDYSVSKEIQKTAVINLQKQIDAFTQMQTYFDATFKFR